MKPRPKSLTLVAWLVIITSVAWMARIPVTWGEPGAVASLPGGPFEPNLLFAGTYAKLLAQIVACAAVIGGYRWGRTLFVAAGVAWSAFWLYRTGCDPRKIREAILFVIGALFMFRRPAADFFRSAAAMRQPSSARQRLK